MEQFRGIRYLGLDRERRRRIGGTLQMSKATDVICMDINCDVLLMSREEQYDYLKDLIELEIPLNKMEMQTWMDLFKF